MSELNRGESFEKDFSLPIVIAEDTFTDDEITSVHDFLNVSRHFNGPIIVSELYKTYYKGITVYNLRWLGVDDLDKSEEYLKFYESEIKKSNFGLEKRLILDNPFYLVQKNSNKKAIDDIKLKSAVDALVNEFNLTAYDFDNLITLIKGVEDANSKLVNNLFNLDDSSLAVSYLNRSNRNYMFDKARIELMIEMLKTVDQVEEALNGQEVEKFNPTIKKAVRFYSNSITDALGSRYECREETRVTVGLIILSYVAICMMRQRGEDILSNKNCSDDYIEWTNNINNLINFTRNKALLEYNKSIEKSITRPNG